MKKSFASALRVVLTLAVAAATVALSGIQTAAADACVMRTDGWIGCDMVKSSGSLSATATTPGSTMSMPVSKLLKAAFDAGARKDWATARARLTDALAVENPSAMDVFEMNVTASFIAINTGDHPAALAAYKRTIADPQFSTALSPPEQRATLKNTMVLCNETGDYKGAIAFGQRMIALGAIDNVSAVSLALAYFGNGDFAKALSLAQKAIDAAVAAGIKPSDTALEIVLKSNAALAH